MSNIPGTEIPDIPTTDWSAHLAADIAAFLTAVQGEDVRAEFVDMAYVIANVILKQAAYTTADLTDENTHAAARASAVLNNGILYRGAAQAGSDLNELGNGFWIIQSAYAYTNLPMFAYGETHEAPTTAVLFCIDHVIRLQVYVDFHTCVYSRRRVLRSGTNYWDYWSGGIDDTLKRPNAAADAYTVGVELARLSGDQGQAHASELGMMRHFAYADPSAQGYYLTRLRVYGLDEVDAGAWNVGQNINAAGVAQQIDYCAATAAFLDAGPGQTFYFGGSKYGRVNAATEYQGYFFVFLHEYKDNGEYIGRTGFLASGGPLIPTPVTTGPECAKIKFVFAYNADAGLQMTLDDILRYCVFYKEAET